MIQVPKKFRTGHMTMITPLEVTVLNLCTRIEVSISSLRITHIGKRRHRVEKVETEMFWDS